MNPALHNSHNDLHINGVMFNVYPDSIGNSLSDIITLFRMPEFENAFSIFYILPSVFNSDLDRGFSIIDYNINKELASDEDIEALQELGFLLKFDIVLNHLSVASPQFKDLLRYGKESAYRDFFINWNTFWEGHGEMNEEGIIVPHKEFLDYLFMRKPGLPILKIKFPDGSFQPYWNTFYQKTSYKKLSTEELDSIEGLDKNMRDTIYHTVNQAIENDKDIETIELGSDLKIKNIVLEIIGRNQHYLGQMDVNARSPKVWEYYEEVLAKLSSYGCRLLRLDAFAYLHKEIGESNFFNIPGTWDYLGRIHKMAQKYNLILLPEIHSEYGTLLHREVANEGYYIYDFFLPGLIIHTLEKGSAKALKRWAGEIIDKGYKTVNMLGCHDGIPVLDLKGKKINDSYNTGLLEDEEIEDIITLILNRGGRVKNIYGADGHKISYYQVNATYFSALGESHKKLLLARAIQLFMPGIPQVWYLDLFAGKNDNEAVDKAGKGGHKEINRTTLSMSEVRERLKTNIVTKQLEMIRLRNTNKAFLGDIDIKDTPDELIEIHWINGSDFASLTANLKTYDFSIHSSGQEISQG